MNLYGCRVHVTEKDVHPFSFFNKIVISRKTLNCPNLRMIIDHESIHVKEKHTLDILLTEVLFILQWFNPFVWLIKDAVKNNLEYKTDDKIIKHPQQGDLSAGYGGTGRQEGRSTIFNSIKWFTTQKQNHHDEEKL
jgi:hypothetical protein